MDYKHILYGPGKVARIILNRPRFFNAQGWLMREEMDDAFAQAAADEKVGAVVLSGAGPHFSAGHDIGTEEDQAYRQARGRSQGPSPVRNRRPSRNPTWPWGRPIHVLPRS